MAPIAKNHSAAGFYSKNQLFDLTRFLILLPWMTHCEKQQVLCHHKSSTPNHLKSNVQSDVVFRFSQNRSAFRNELCPFCLYIGLASLKCATIICKEWSKTRSCCEICHNKCTLMAFSCRVLLFLRLLLSATCHRGSSATTALRSVKNRAET